MPDYVVKYLEDSLAAMVKTDGWDGVCKNNGWTRAFMGSADFKAFLDKTNAEYQDLLTQIGLFKGN